MKVYTKISKETLRNLLHMEKEAFEIHLLDWGIEYGFRIDDTQILLDGANVTGFLAEMENSYNSQ